MVNPSGYAADFIRDNIREPFVREQIAHICKYNQNFEEATTIPQYEENQQMASVKKANLQSSVIENYDNMCPSCKAKLIVTEGCNMCIECGFSSCGSG